MRRDLNGRAAAWLRLFRKRVAPGSPAPTEAGENQALLPVAAEGEVSFVYHCLPLVCCIQT